MLGEAQRIALVGFEHRPVVRLGLVRPFERLGDHEHRPDIDEIVLLDLVEAAPGEHQSALVEVRKQGVEVQLHLAKALLHVDDEGADAEAR